MELDAVVPRPVGARWTPSAVAGLVGQCPTLNGQPARVVDARMDDVGDVHVTLQVDGDLGAELLRGLTSGLSL